MLTHANILRLCNTYVLPPLPVSFKGPEMMGGPGWLQDALIHQIGLWESLAGGDTSQIAVWGSCRGRNSGAERWCSQLAPMLARCACQTRYDITRLAMQPTHTLLSFSARASLKPFACHRWAPLPFNSSTVFSGNSSPYKHPITSLGHPGLSLIAPIIVDHHSPARCALGCYFCFVPQLPQLGPLLQLCSCLPGLGHCADDGIPRQLRPCRESCHHEPTAPKKSNSIDIALLHLQHMPVL